MREMRIDILSSSDAPDVARMLNRNSKKYQQYFTPFSFDETTIASMLSSAVRDKFWGVWKEDDLIAFFMLRGMDEGFETPAYGACVAEAHQGMGLLKLTLQFVLSWCKVYSVPKLMLKVHPENAVAKQVYEKFGFVQKGIDEKNKNLIYYYVFT